MKMVKEWWIRLERACGSSLWEWTRAGSQSNTKVRVVIEGSKRKKGHRGDGPTGEHLQTNKQMLPKLQKASGREERMIRNDILIEKGAKWENEDLLES